VIQVSITGAGATSAQACSSPEIPRQDGARRSEVTSTCQAPITVCRIVASHSPSGSGVTSARACSTVGIPAAGTARRAEAMTTQGAMIIISKS